MVLFWKTRERERERERDIERKREGEGERGRNIKDRGLGYVKIILKWTTSLDTSSRTLFVREGGRMSVRMSTSRRTSSYVITSDCY